MDTCRNSRLSTSIFAIVSTVAGVLAAGCGGEETYSDKHLASIQYDCTQTAPCDPVFSIRQDSVGECIADTSTKLDRGTEAMQANYEMRFSRCAGQTGCDYFACAGDSMLFSFVNEQKLRYDCAQQTACGTMQAVGAMPVDETTCFKMLAQRLDFASVPDKASYDQRFGRCGTLVGCAFTSCK
jgi:hypothetical protein